MILNIPIPKAGKTPDGKPVTLEIDTDAITDGEEYAFIFAEGLKALLNSRMSKVGAVTKLSGDALAKENAAALAIANENKTRLLAGEFHTKRGAKAKSDTPREVTTEARRIARDMVKNLIRASGGKPSHYKASEITDAADVIISEDTTILAKARENLANRAGLTTSVNVLSLVHTDPKKIAEAETKKKQRAEQLSAKQAGLTTKTPPVRQRPPVAPHAVH